MEGFILKKIAEKLV